VGGDRRPNDHVHLGRDHQEKVARRLRHRRLRLAQSDRRPRPEAQLRSPSTEGANEVVVEITNFRRNRLIGDQQLPESERLTRANVAKWRADSPLAPPTLLGPVTLRRGR
jgi:hypothetical protein